MSAWKILVRRLHDLGGGPLPRRAFDNNGDELGEKSDRQLDAAVRHGLVQARRYKFEWRWTLTDRGRDWCEGRFNVVEVGKPGVNGRGKQVMQATWLKALPRAGEIRL